MPRPVRRSPAQLEPEIEERRGFRTWAADRAALLLAIGVLFTLVAILVAISLLHPR
jgi:hypothetical protein